MTQDTHELLERALLLPVEARADLIQQLIKSLDEGESEDPAELERAWGDEIARRIREVVEGRVDAVPFDLAMTEVRKAIERERARPKP